MNFIDIQNKVMPSSQGINIDESNYHFMYSTLHGVVSDMVNCHSDEGAFFNTLAKLNLYCFTWLGSVDFSYIDWNEVIADYNDDDSQPWSSGCKDKIEFCTEIHSTISASFMSYIDHETSRSFLAAIVICSFCFALESNQNLEKIILSKIEA